MEKQNDREFSTIDEHGNSWVLSLKQQEKYPNRSDLSFSFNEKTFKIQQFGSEKNAGNVWELIELISKKQK